LPRAPRVGHLTVAFGLVLGALGACSSDPPDEVVIDEGSVPDDATTTSTTAGSTTTGPPTSGLGPPTLDDSSPVTTAGVGAVEFGMSVAEAEAAGGSRLVPVDPDDATGCYEVELEQGPLGLRFTVADDTIERLDVVDGAVATRSGAGIGDTAQQLRDLFPDQLEEGADPDGEGQVLTFVPQDEGDAGTRIIFVIEDDEVASFRAGRRPIVDTGC
jgi:hypothetical protein